MGNLKDKYTDEEWEELELSIKANAEAKKQALKDMQEEMIESFGKVGLPVYTKERIEKKEKDE